MSAQTFKLAVRRKWSMGRQRAILTLRYLFRIPIDQIRENQERVILENQQQIVEQLNAQLRFIHQVSARLSWYERRIPSIKKEYAAFVLDQKKRAKAKPK